MATNFLDKHFGRFGNRMFQLAYIYAQFRDGNIPDIYLQNPKYFEKYSTEIKAMFEEEIEEREEVSIHVRRGANPSNPSEPFYHQNPFYVNLMETDYYERAMKEFPGRKFLVFSDDIEWCYEQEIFKDCEFSEGVSELDDFIDMASCDGHIMANSSFSWWSSYLGKGKVIYPLNWFRDGIQRVGFPKDWIGI